MNTQTLPRSAKGSLRGAIGLISTTCIGAGMLAMPVQAAESGFFPTLCFSIVSWLFMTYTGLCLVEVTLWYKGQAHFPSLTSALLGRFGKWSATCIYLMMNYLSLVAYTAGGAQLVSIWCHRYLGIALSYEWSCLPYVICFGCIAMMNSYLIGNINLVFTTAMIGAYLIIVQSVCPLVQLHLLTERALWWHGIGIFSTILASFSYQMIIPTVCSYLHYDKHLLRKAVWIGTLIPLLVYVVWVMVIHGIIPLHGEHGLLQAAATGSAATRFLGHYIHNINLEILTDIFAFLAVTTSYVSLSLALLTFLQDLIRNSPFRVSKPFIGLLTFIPTLSFAILFPRALLSFFDLSGGLGDSMLSCLIPVMMVWIGRYVLDIKGEYQVFGGKLGLILTALFSLMVFGFEWWKLYQGHL